MSLRQQIMALAMACCFAVSGAASACESGGLQEACHPSPDELMRQAAALNADKRYTEAADLLERVLMQYPQTQDAERQYQQALAGLDSRLDGEAHLQSSQTDAWQSWQTSTGLQLQGGYSSNLNQAPSQSTIQLTLPSGSVALELLPQFQRQVGFGLETRLSENAVRTTDDKLQWQLRGELFNRRTDYGGYADYQGVNLQTGVMQQSESGSETGAALGLNTLHYDSDVYLYTVQMMLRHTGNKGAYCKPQTGIDILWQRQHGNPMLDSRYAGLMVGTLCDTKFGLYTAAISGGWDWAANQRPGGDQLRTRLELNGIWPTNIISQNSFLKANATILQNNDMRSYSPWLSAGAERYIKRASMELDYDWSLDIVAKNWRGVASIKWQKQGSNISLFEMDALEGWLGVRTLW